MSMITWYILNALPVLAVGLGFIVGYILTIHYLNNRRDPWS